MNFGTQLIDCLRVLNIIRLMLDMSSLLVI